MRAAVLCPSRGRPELALKLATSVLETSDHASILFALDEDDPLLPQYDQIPQIDRIQVHISERSPVTHKMNGLIRRPRFDAYGMLPDDAVITTKGWDTWLTGVLADQPMAVISPHHNNHGEIDMPFVSNKWVQTMGWFAYPHLMHFCWPFVLGVIGHATKLVFATPEQFHIQHTMEGAPNLEMYRDDAIKYFEHFALNYTSWIHKARAAM